MSEAPAATSMPAAYWPRAAMALVVAWWTELAAGTPSTSSQSLETTKADQCLVLAAESVRPASVSVTRVAPPAGTTIRCRPLVEMPCTVAAFLSPPGPDVMLTTHVFLS